MIEKSGIYCIRNINNDKRYIGQSKNMKQRKLEHFKMLKNNNHHSIKLQRAYNKEDDKNMFQFEIIELVKDIYELTNKEQYYIDYYDSYYNGYNCLAIACSSRNNILPKNFVKFNTEFKFVKLFKNNIHKVHQYLTGSELQLIFFLFKYISYRDNKLRHANGVYVSARHISKEMNISTSHIYKKMSILSKKEFIIIYRNGKKAYYIFNPFICLKGIYIDKDILELFKNTKWAKRFD